MDAEEKTFELLTSEKEFALCIAFKKAHESAFQKAHGFSWTTAVSGTIAFELVTIMAEVLVMRAFWKLMHAHEA